MMEPSSETTRIPNLFERGKTFCEQAGRFCLKMVRPIFDGAIYVGEKAWEGAKRLYEKHEPRFFAKAQRVKDGWERRGWPPFLLGLIANGLLYLPLDLGWYLLAWIEHGVTFNVVWLLIWLVFAGSVRGARFYYKEVYLDQRIARGIDKGSNRPPLEGEN